MCMVAMTHSISMRMLRVVFSLFNFRSPELRPARGFLSKNCWPTIKLNLQRPNSQELPAPILFSSNCLFPSRSQVSSHINESSRRLLSFKCH